MHVVISSLFFLVVARVVSWSAVFAAILFGIVFALHWFRLGMDRLVASFTLAVYFGGCVILAFKLFTTIPFLAL